MSVTAVRFVRKDLEEMEWLVRKGYYSNKSDLIKTAVRNLIRETIDRELNRRIPRKEITERGVNELNEEIRSLKRDVLGKNEIHRS